MIWLTLADYFHAEKQEGVLRIVWGDVEALVIPLTQGETSEKGGLGVTGRLVGLAGKTQIGKDWTGESALLIRQHGKTPSVEVWNRREEIEANLRTTGVATKISAVYDAVPVVGGDIGMAGATMP